jgi:hypothetical protein
MLFQSYTSGRLVEFVHSSKGKASQDPLGEVEDANKYKCPQEAMDGDYNDESDIGDDPKYNDSDLEDDDDAANEDIDETTNCDSGYNTNEIEVIIIENMDTYYNTKIDEFKELV